MSLAPGTRLGPYEVLAKIGEGGPPLLIAASGRSFGASAVAQARIWL